MEAQWAGLAIGVIGLIPLVHALRLWVLDRLPTRRLFGFRRSKPLDIVLTTSGTESENVEGGVALAHYTVVGDVRGVAWVSRMLSHTYPRLSFSVTMSESYAGNPDGSIVLVGGPLYNKWSRFFLDGINRDCNDCVELDAGARRLRVGGNVVESFDQRTEDGVPSEDLGLVVIAPWAGGTKRTVLCGGFSTYGTEGAARFVTSDLLHDKRLLARVHHLARGNEVIAIGVHILIEARHVQHTRVMKVDGEDMIWVGSRAQD